MENAFLENTTLPLVPPSHYASALLQVEAMLLALSTPCRNKSALPHVHQTLPLGELFHRAIVACLGNGRRVDCPELTGTDRQGRPLRDGHRHAHVLPLDLDGDEQLDHVLVYAPMGLGDAAQRAIQSLKRTWTKGRVRELQVAVVGRGDLAAIWNLPEPQDFGVTRLLGSEPYAKASGSSGGILDDDQLLNDAVRSSLSNVLPAASGVGSRTWISLTPFVPPRFVKPRGRNSIEGQINAELESRGLPTADHVIVMENEALSLRHFVRVRGRGNKAPPCDTGYAVQIQFPQPVSGPIALGYGSHFGLGMFAAT